jgi:FMN phosphatase YigB (HAD superfamily)
VAIVLVQVDIEKAEKAEADRKAKAEAERLAKEALERAEKADKKPDPTSDLTSNLNSTIGPDKLRSTLTVRWQASKWRKGHAFVLKEALETFDLASYELAKCVYKVYLDSNGDSKAFDELLRHHGMDPSPPSPPLTSTETSTQP